MKQMIETTARNMEKTKIEKTQQQQTQQIKKREIHLTQLKQ